MSPIKVAIVYYKHFAPLDVFGPIEAMNCSFGLQTDGVSPDKTSPLFEILSVGQKIENIQSGMGRPGPQILCENDFSTLPQVDMVLIPGGIGSRDMVKQALFIDQLKTLVNKTPIVLSVCTGAGLLAKTGYLDGKKATSNKIAWPWVIGQNAEVDWQCLPRWIGQIDQKAQRGYMTSAGVSAGIDMMLAVINQLFGAEVVLNTQNMMEYSWQNMPENDPFASLCATYRDKS